MARKQQPLRVIESFHKPVPNITNPYIVMLQRALQDQPDLLVEHFTFGSALLRQHDVFHVHWPESLTGSSRTWYKRLGRQVLYFLFLLRCRLTRTAIVRTAHNVDLPQGLPPWETALLKLTDRWTDLRIVLNSATPVPDNADHVLIRHSHFKDWFQSYAVPESIPGRVAFFGRIRRYKSVDDLVRAFRQVEDGVAKELRISGRPSSDELVSTLTGLAGPDQRIAFNFGFIDDAEVVREVGEAELVVLPAVEMHNSGSALTTLSLGRPILVPDNEVNSALSAEVGPGWVHLFDAPLSAEDITNALTSIRTNPAPSAPDLSQREWTNAGAAHAAAFRAAVNKRRRIGHAST